MSKDEEKKPEKVKVSKEKAVQALKEFHPNNYVFAEKTNFDHVMYNDSFERSGKKKTYIHMPMWYDTDSIEKYKEAERKRNSKNGKEAPKSEQKYNNYPPVLLSTIHKLRSPDAHKYDDEEDIERARKMFLQSWDDAKCRVEVTIYPPKSFGKKPFAIIDIEGSPKHLTKEPHGKHWYDVLHKFYEKIEKDKKAIVDNETGDFVEEGKEMLDDVLKEGENVAPIVKNPVSSYSKQGNPCHRIQLKVSLEETRESKNKNKVYDARKAKFYLPGFYDLFECNPKEEDYYLQRPKSDFPYTLESASANKTRKTVDDEENDENEDKSYDRVVKFHAYGFPIVKCTNLIVNQSDKSKEELKAILDKPFKDRSPDESIGFDEGTLTYEMKLWRFYVVGGWNTSTSYKKGDPNKGKRNFDSKTRVGKKSIFGNRN